MIISCITRAYSTFC